LKIGGTPLPHQPETFYSMNITPRITTTGPKMLMGLTLTMSLAHDRTGELWRTFIPRRKEIASVNSLLYNVKVYDARYFTHFSLEKPFTKWAAMEVSETGPTAEGMLLLQLPGGLYAVFDYKGSSADTSIYEYIFQTWLPASGYALDQRPHFDVLGEKYRNQDPASEEEIWIPIRPADT
jgi:AraC family transcriptional regulator